MMKKNIFIYCMLVMLINITSLFSISQSGIDALLKKVEKGDLDSVKKYLEENGDVNVKDKKSNTMLLMACRYNRDDIFDEIMKYNPEIDIPNNSILTPIHFTVVKNNVRMFKILMEKGADLKRVNDFEDTLLSTAARNGSTEILDILIKQGLDVNVKIGFENTPLIAAARFGKPETIELLLKNNANINDSNRYQRTALIIAVIEKQVDSIRTLLKYNPDLNIKDEKGLTAADYAKKSNNKEIKEMLIVK